MVPFRLIHVPRQVQARKPYHLLIGAFAFAHSGRGCCRSAKSATYEPLTGRERERGKVRTILFGGGGWGSQDHAWPRKATTRRRDEQIISLRKVDASCSSTFFEKALEQNRPLAIPAGVQCGMRQHRRVFNGTCVFIVLRFQGKIIVVTVITCRTCASSRTALISSTTAAPLAVLVSDTLCPPGPSRVK